MAMPELPAGATHVTIRVPVAIDVSGSWAIPAASGFCDGQAEVYPRRLPLDQQALKDNDRREPQVVHWVSITVPLPKALVGEVVVPCFHASTSRKCKGFAKLNNLGQPALCNECDVKAHAYPKGSRP